MHEGHIGVKDTYSSSPSAAPHIVLAEGASNNQRPQQNFPARRFHVVRYWPAADLLT